MIPNGVKIDERSFLEKEQDYTHERYYAGMPPVWVEKTQFKLPKQRIQDGSYTCIMQGSMTGLGILFGTELSAAPYKLRKGGGQGMYLQDAGDILYNTGTYLETIVPSQNMNDAAIDSIVLPSSALLKVTGYRTFTDHTDINAIAEAIQAYGHCNITFVSNGDEWQLTPVYIGTPVTFGHNICAVDFCLINGVKTLICMDSAGQTTSPTGIRYITEDFLKNRSTGSIYYLGVKVVTEKAFNRQLSYGSVGTDVLKLQKYLVQEGFATFIPTGFFGNLTGSAIMKLQGAHGITPQVPRVGPATLILLNSLNS